MPNPWFRLYSEFADDPKVQMLPEAMQRRLVMLFCSRCKGETLHETERAFHWRISADELAETKKAFMAKGFIDDAWTLLNWNKRQFLSDSSTDRVRRFRQAKKQGETLHETNGTQDETFRGTQGTESVTAPDTEQIQNRTDSEGKSVLPEAAMRLPAIGGKDYAVTKPQVDHWKELYPGVDVMQELRNMRGWIEANPTKRKTCGGMARFITGWLAREQNQGNGARQAPVLPTGSKVKSAYAVETERQIAEQRRRRAERTNSGGKNA